MAPSSPWNLVVARSAGKQLSKIPAADQTRILAALDQMRADPFSGDVVYLKNLPQALRRRVGNFRILFDVDPEERLIVVSAILRRSSTTY